MPKLSDIAPIIWAKWGGTFLEALRQEALDAPDQLAFAAMNSDAGVRTVLLACTTDDARIPVVREALQLPASVRPVDWNTYSAAEMIFRTEKRGGLSHQESCPEDGRLALVLCATRPQSVRALVALLDLPE